MLLGYLYRTFQVDTKTVLQYKTTLLYGYHAIQKVMAEWAKYVKQYNRSGERNLRYLRRPICLFVAATFRRLSAVLDKIWNPTFKKSRQTEKHSTGLLHGQLFMADCCPGAFVLKGSSLVWL